MDSEYNAEESSRLETLLANAAAAATTDATPTAAAAATTAITQGTHAYGKKKPRQRPDKRSKRATAKADQAQLNSLLTNLQRQPEITELSGDISSQMLSQTYECIVCYEVIRRNDGIWNCQTCFKAFHMHCIRKWAKTSSGDSGHEWRCPGCQNVSPYTPKNRCYCGKVTNPEWNPSGPPPHSCGELCEKLRPNKCKHRCTATCHPGPCEKCPLLVTQPCFCGQTSRRVQCSSELPVTGCGKTCGKKLNCKVHRCAQTCHEGTCKPCEVKEEQSCFCGKSTRVANCGSGQGRNSQKEGVKYSCKEPCGRPRDCGKHTCDAICHSGKCSPCELTPEKVKTCPCGRNPLRILVTTPRTSCTDPIPECPGECNKILPCSDKVGEVHRCKRTCHLGPCSTCDVPIPIPCRCGETVQKVPCHEFIAGKHKDDSVRCQRVCKRRRHCGRHRCQEVCCPLHQIPDAEAHPCNLPCNKTLRCGVHKCEDTCHPGHCLPCANYAYDPISCACGKTVLQPPIQCGTTLPDCQFPCTRPRDCPHPAHHQCHVQEQCPPCPVLVEKMCVGGHEVRKAIQCHVKEVSCGKPCGKPYPCGIHTCPDPCHSGDCKHTTAPVRTTPKVRSSEDWWGEEDDDAPSVTLANPPCGLKCNQIRPCGHKCQVPCHPGESCPKNVICKAKILGVCSCTARQEMVVCRFGEDGGADVAAIQMLQHPNSAEDVKIPTKKIPCDRRCAIIAKTRAQELRNRQLAMALDIDDAKVSSEIGEEYSPFLLEEARRHPKFIKSIENSLATFLKHSMKRYDFPCMKQNDREIIHEVAQHYGLTSESFDVEPKRNVAVFKTLNERIPEPLLSAAATKQQSR